MLSKPKKINISKPLPPKTPPKYSGGAGEQFLKKKSDIEKTIPKMNNKNIKINK